jgi:ABC-type glycerol-3-phosphate transport system permease component
MELSGQALASASVGWRSGSSRVPLDVIGRHVLVYGVAFLILLPFIWVLLSAFKSESELFRYPPTLLPEEWTVENFTQFFQATSFHIAMFNSGMLAAATALFAMAVAAPAAYALARYHNPLFENIARLFVYTYMIPGILLVLPVYKIFFNLGLANNIWALVPIYTALVLPLMLWTLRSFFAGIPVELEEAAMIDGATRFQAFWKIALPQAVPGMIATGIVAVNIGWSEYLFASTLLTTQDNMTISPRLASFMGRGLYNWGWLMAGALAVTAPLILISGFMQRFLIAGWGAGALKG